MFTLNRLHKKNVGLPPGTLIIPGQEDNYKCRITHTSYNPETFSTSEIPDLKSELIQERENTCTWIHIEAIDNLDIINQLGSNFGISNMILEDILNTSHRPKLELIQDSLFIVIKNYFFNKKTEKIEQDQISIYYSKNHVISIQKTNNPTFRVIEERIADNRGLIRKKSSDYLFYCLLDVIIDNYFEITDIISEKISLIEKELLLNPDKTTLNNLYLIKNDILTARSSISPLREIIGNLKNIKDSVYITDLHDHTLQVIDTVNTLRDITSNMFDLYLSVANNKMNEIMKILTTIGTIFIPLTFVAGIYGMNFHYMPELEIRYAYPVLLVLLLAAAAGMLLFFKKKGWF